MKATDDPLQAALDEAASLMNELEQDVVDISLNDNDEEDLHPLHDHFFVASPPSVVSLPVAPALSVSTSTDVPLSAIQANVPQQPLSVRPQQPLLQQLPVQEPVLLQPQQFQHLQPQPPQQLQHVQHQPVQYPSPSSATATARMMPSSNDTTTWKLQTRQFANNIATMAQRGLQQVQEHSNFLPSPAAQSSVLSTVTTATTTTSNTLGGVVHHIHSNATTPPTIIITPPVHPEQQQLLLQTHVRDFMPGEKIILFCSGLPYVADSRGVTATAWCAVVTYYRLILFPASSDISSLSLLSGTNSLHPACQLQQQPVSSQQLLQIPLACLEKIEKSTLTQQQPPQPQMLILTVTSKLSGYWIRLACASQTETLKVAESLETFAFPGRRNLGYLFAFECQRDAVLQSIVQNDQGHKIVTLDPTPKRFDALTEFTRLLGMQQHGAWKIWMQCNAQYQLCPSYPSVMVGPASLDELDVVVRKCAAFRSEYRWPALTWGNAVDGASIWRCAQPKMGLQGNRSSADEYYVQQIMKQAGRLQQQQSASLEWTPSQLQALTGANDLSNWYPEGQSLKILDLRPRASAMANRTAGYGYENTSYYPGTTLQFCNIGNIHAMRDAYQKVSAVALHSTDMQWQSNIEDSKWLSSIRLIWAAAWETAFWVHVHRMPVLLHCSHGWDRTSQVAALAQLLLDGHYRTRKGFATLVEKDFHAFGHPFHTRCAHGEGGTDQSVVDEGQVSPIFLQFLDCVYQLVRLYPDAFEFNTHYLLELSNHIYSCRFGTFLCDTEREREVTANLRQRTQSVWDELEAREDLCHATFQNNPGVLLVPLPLLLRNITLWHDRHAMHGMKPVLRLLPNELEQDMWRRLLCGTAVEVEPASNHNESLVESEQADKESEEILQESLPATSSFTIDDQHEDDE